MAYPGGEPEADKDFQLFLDEVLLDGTGSTSSHTLNRFDGVGRSDGSGEALAPTGAGGFTIAAMGSGNLLSELHDNRPAQPQDKQQLAGSPVQQLLHGMSGPSGSAEETQVAAEPRKGLSRKSSRRSSRTDAPHQISSLAQVRSLESQVDGYHDELADLMRTNLHLKEREFMTQEMVAYRVAQETFLRTGALPPPSNHLLGVSTMFTHAGLMGSGNQHAPASKDSLGGSTNVLLECRDSVDQLLRLTAPELDAAYASMVPELAIMVSQAEADPAVQEQLDQTMTNLHWAFDTLIWLHPEGRGWLAGRRDNPLHRGAPPPTKVHGILASLKLSAKQIDRMGDVTAMLQPRLDALGAEQQQLLTELHGQPGAEGTAALLPPPPPQQVAAAPPLAAATQLPPTGPAGLSLDDSARHLPDGSHAVPDELTAHLPLLIGLESDDTMTKLQRNVSNMVAIMCLLYSFVSSRILSSTQFARLHVNSFPWFPHLDKVIHLALMQRGAGVPSSAANTAATPVAVSARSRT